MATQSNDVGFTEVKKILVFTSPPGGALDPAGALKDSFPLSNLTTYASAIGQSAQTIANLSDVKFNTPGSSAGYLTPPAVNGTSFTIAAGGGGLYAYEFQIAVKRSAATPIATFGLTNGTNPYLISVQTITFSGDGYAFLTGTGQADLMVGSVTLRNFSGDPLDLVIDAAVPNPVRLSLQRLGVSDLPVAKSAA